MDLCDGARDLRQCIVQMEENSEKNCARNARIPALGYGAVQEKGERQEAQPSNYSYITQKTFTS